MPHCYTYECGWVDMEAAVYVYRSKDGLIGLRVEHQRCGGLWNKGHSRFFVWDNKSHNDDFEWERQARDFLGSNGSTTSSMSHGSLKDQSERSRSL